jgi:hypothetical protein
VEGAGVRREWRVRESAGSGGCGSPPGMEGAGVRREWGGSRGGRRESAGSRERGGSQPGVRRESAGSPPGVGCESGVRRESGREPGEIFFAIWMQAPRRVAENTIRGSGCVSRVACGSPPPGSSDQGSPQKRLSRLSSAPSGGVPVRRWLSMRWDACRVRPAERSPGVGRSVGCIPFSMPKHGGRCRVARRWMCGLVPIRVRAASEARNLKAARALGSLAIAGVPRVVPPRLRCVLPSSPPGADAPGLGIAKAPRKGAFRSKGS